MKKIIKVVKPYPHISGKLYPVGTEAIKSQKGNVYLLDGNVHGAVYPDAINSFTEYFKTEFTYDLGDHFLRKGTIDNWTGGKVYKPFKTFISVMGDGVVIADDKGTHHKYSHKDIHYDFDYLTPSQAQEIQASEIQEGKMILFKPTGSYCKKDDYYQGETYGEFYKAIAGDYKKVNGFERHEGTFYTATDLKAAMKFAMEHYSNCMTQIANMDLEELVKEWEGKK